MDIKNTPLDQLFARLQQAASTRPIGERRRSPRNGPQPKTPKLPPKAAQPRPQPPKPIDHRPLLVRSSWTPEAVILIIREISCDCCGSQFTVPNDRLLLRQRNRLLGTYCKPINPPEAYPHLPHVTEYVRSQVTDCQHCFGTAQLIRSVRNAPRQLDLFTPAETAA